MQTAMLLRARGCSILSHGEDAVLQQLSRYLAPTAFFLPPLQCPLSSGCGDCAVDVPVAARTLSHSFLWVWPVVDVCNTVCGLHSETPVRDERRIDGVKRSV